VHRIDADSGTAFGKLKVATFSDANDPFELLALNCRGKSRRGVRKALKQFKKSQGDKIGMLCFSKSWTSPVLWSHYADGHKGVCLGFDLKRDLVEEVKYADERLTANLSDVKDPPPIPEDLQDLLLVTKYRRWQYENEMRRFVELSKLKPVRGIYFWRFDNDMRLREVILGPLCPSSELGPFRSLIANARLDAEVSRARLGYGSFEVRPDGKYPPS
jgi:Protein of unknown function (DUF2971)